MNAKNLIIGGIVGGIVLWLLGWLIYGVLMNWTPDAALGWRDEPNILFILFSEIVFAVLISAAIGWSNSANLQDGAKIGAILGLLVSLIFGLSMYAFRVDMELSQVAIDAVVSIVRVGITGAVIGLVLGKVG